MRKIVLKTFISFLIVCLTAYLSPIPQAYANPEMGQVTAGSANIHTHEKTTTINQASDRAVIDWKNFNIKSDEVTRFNQPNSSSITVNRINDKNPSQILGTLSANGNIVLINPNGVFFGKDSRVDVGGLLATTSKMLTSESDFMNGAKLKFTAGSNPDAVIENQGSITAKDAGLVGLVAPGVKNSGVITAKLGTVHMASGNIFTMDMYGDGLLEVGMGEQVTKQIVENKGSINAAGGVVKLTAAAGRKIVNSLVDFSGEIHAPTIGKENGKIIIAAAGTNKTNLEGKSTALVDGKLEAHEIDVFADNVGILKNAELHSDGGKIRIGGDFYGKGDSPAAISTIIQKGSNIFNNNGDVAVWSDNYTDFAGNIEAKGGFVETSGKALLNASGNVNAKTWLLDPYNVTIGSTTTNSSGNADSPLTFTLSGTAVINASTISSALTGGTSVIINTGSTGSPGGDLGDIAFNSSLGTINLPNDVTLTLSAYRNIIFGNAVTITATGSKLNLVVNADNGGNGSGYVRFNGAANANVINIDTNGGNINIGGGTASGGLPSGAAVGNATSNAAHGVSLSYATLNAKGGAITIRGLGVANAGTAHGVFLDNSSSIKTESGGTITITGNGGGTSGITNAGTSSGVQIQGGSNFISENGDITLIGTGGGIGTGTTNYGVGVSEASSYVRTFGSGSIRITNAQGGNTTGSGNTNHGVNLAIANALRADSTGSIIITATGGGSTSSNNYGINISGSIYTTTNGEINLNGSGGVTTGNGNIGVFVADNITAGGTGKITITGTGRSNTSSGNGGTHYGVRVENGAIILAGNGGIEINATSTGGAGTGTNNYGLVATGNNTLIKTTGTGNITILNAQGGNTTGSGSGNYGIRLQTSTSNASDHGILAAGTGSISISATGGGFSGANNYGVSVESKIISNGGSISIIGTGGNSSGASNYGVNIDGTSVQTSGSGAITIEGYGGGGSGNSGVDYGISISAGGFVEAQNGEIRLTGIGGGAGTGATNYGLYISGTNTEVRTIGSGDIRVLKAYGGNNTGTGTSATNYGLRINATGGIETEGTGNIYINDVKAGGLLTTSNAQQGTYLGGYIRAASNHNIEMISVGRGTSGTTNYGIEITGGEISTTGTGTINVQATAGGTGNSATNYGLYLNSGGIISTENGQLIATGTGGGGVGGSGANNIGVYITGTSSSIKSTGSGSVTITGIRGGGDATSNYGIRASSANSFLTGTNGDLTIKTDFAFINIASAITSGGNLAIGTYTDAMGMSVGSSVANTLNISTTHLGYLTWGTGKVLTLGNSTTGPITINTNHTFPKETHFVTKAGHDITVEAQITNSAAGNALVLASGDDVINSFGATAFNLTGGGRWIVYSEKVADDTLGGLSPAQTIYSQTFGSLAPASITTPTYNATQNTWVYSTAAPITGSVTITATAQSVTYGTAPNTSGVLNTTYTFSCSDGCASTVITAGPTLGISGGSTSTSGNYNVGTLTITPSGVTVSNGYTINYATANLTVAAKQLTITGVTASNKTYDANTTATLNTASAALSGKVTNDVVNLSTAGAAGTFASANAATGIAINTSGFSVSGTDSGNYTLTQPSTTANITAANLTLTANNISGTYGSSGANTLNGSTGFTPTGLVSGQTVGSVTLTTTATSSTSGNYNAGNWSLTPSAATGGTFNASNYNISYVAGTHTISTKALTVSGISGTNKIYDGTTTGTITGTAALSGLVAGLNNGGGTSDAVTLNTGSATAAFADDNVGAGKTVTFSGYSVSGADSGNYIFSQPATSTANITARAITVTADAKSATYGDTLGTLTYQLSGGSLASGDSFTGTLTTSGGGAGTVLSNANGFNVSGSPYNITQGSLLVSDGNSGNNYSITYSSANLTLSAKTLTITGVTAGNRVYDQNTAATLNTASAALAGAVTGDTVNLDSSGATGAFTNKNVGNGKAVNISGFTLSGAQSGNYSLTQPTGVTANITPATLTVTGITANNKVYDGTTTATLTTAGSSLAGVIAGDTANIDNAATQGTFDNKNVGNAKAVTISGVAANGTDAGNYTITQPTGITANITPASLTVTADNATKTEGDPNPAFTATITGFAAGENISNSGVNGSASLTSLADTTSVAGTYAITAALGTLTATNYNFTNFNDGTLTVTVAGTSGGGGGGGGGNPNPPPVTPPPVVPEPPPVIPTTPPLEPEVPTPPVVSQQEVPATVKAVSNDPSIIYVSSKSNSSQSQEASINFGWFLQQAMQYLTAAKTSVVTVNNISPEVQQSSGQNIKFLPEKKKDKENNEANTF